VFGQCYLRLSLDIYLNTPHRSSRRIRCLVLRPFSTPYQGHFFLHAAHGFPSKEGYLNPYILYPLPEKLLCVCTRIFVVHLYHTLLFFDLLVNAS
jgi:hypothetical protein